MRVETANDSKVFSFHHCVSTDLYRECDRAAFIFLKYPILLTFLKNDLVNTDLLYYHPLSHVIFCHAWDYLLLLLTLVCGGRRVASLNAAFIPELLNFTCVL